jgi:methylenetetrahydrofolate dehydrogenase (NADP+) / methenyltetrahydrofolate cyclohydrolase
VLIDGAAYAEDIRSSLLDELPGLPDGAGIATLLVGEDLAAQVYQRRIDRHAQELGVYSRPELLPGDATLGQVVGKIAELDADPQVSGILVLRPLPAHVEEARVFSMLPVLKDVEAQHPVNAGLLSLGMPRFVPSTPAAAFYMLDRYTASVGRDPEIAYDGLDLVLVGRSNNVGKPAAILGLQRNATVISCHRHTFDAGRLSEHTLAADILIVAVGVPGLVTGEMVREGAIVIDIGINALRDGDGSVRLVGDVDTASVEPIAEAVSPVPGGVGPITDMWLLRNTIDAAWLQAGTALSERHRAERIG